MPTMSVGCITGQLNTIVTAEFFSETEWAVTLIYSTVLEIPLTQLAGTVQGSCVQGSQASSRRHGGIRKM